MNRGYLGPFCDHLDVRVRDVARARTFYDPFCIALGLATITVGNEWTSYDAPDPSLPFLAITADPHFVATGTRIALRAGSAGDVDRIAEVASISGAGSYEPPHACPEYAPGYYASFFEDPDGNRYEICYRPLTPTIARVWRDRVRTGLLNEYQEYVAATGLVDYLRTPGNRGAFLLTSARANAGDVLTISLWDSHESISRFAGDDLVRARYYPEDARYLVDLPERVEHFDVTF